MPEKASCYVGLDVGTSGCKASVVDVQGNVLVTARREYAFEYPEKGMVELDPDKVWNCVKECLCEIGAHGYDVRMMAVSSIGESMAMVDEDDNVIRNGIVYLDERGPETVDQVCAKIESSRMQQITGVPSRFYYSLNRFLWLREHEPESIARAKYVFLFGDFITYRLTGARMIDPSTASKTWMLDVSALDWSKEIADAFDIPVEKFSKVVPTGTIAGKIHESLAEETGLPKTMEVVVGCHDQCAAALGAGCVGVGDMVIGEGSSESLNLIIGKDDVSNKIYEKDICLEPYIVPGTFLIPVGQYAHGTSNRWFVKEFWSDLNKDSDRNIYELAMENCADDAGEVFFLPYLSRSNFMDADNHSRGLFIGIEFETDRPKMYRALLEGLCCETRLCFEILKSTNLTIREIVAVGGLSNSELYMQMKSDMLEKKISILETADAGILAMVMICAVADGAYESYKDARDAFVRVKQEYLPNRDYSEKFQKYLKIREAAKLLYNEI